MNVALAWFGKEWRAQWRLLGAYLALSLASVAIVCWCLPAERSFRYGCGSDDALSWFLAIGVAGTLLFAAPLLVRGEFAPKDDQFVRRLPGAIAAASAGKLLFLLLASLLLPLVSLLSGQAVLFLFDRPWLNLGALQDEVRGQWPAGTVAVLATLLLAPWVGAVGTWLPGGRMAVGGTALLLLVVGLGVSFVLSLCPGLEQSLDWQSWAWAVWPAGALVFAWSWRGRRGGSHGRSALHGLCVAAAVVAVPTGWLGKEAWRYHHPDPAHLCDLHVLGVSPDGRFALARGSAHSEWFTRPTFRIDLQTGASERVLACDATLAPATLDQTAPNYARGLRRWWRSFGEDGTRVFDLATGAWREVACKQGSLELALAGELRAAVAADVRERAPYRLPEGRRARREGDTLAIEQSDGSVATVAWPTEFAGAIPRACGHGLSSFLGHCVLVDLQRQRVVVHRPWHWVDEAWVVRGEWIAMTGRGGRGDWSHFDPDACAPTDRTLALEPRPELQGARCRGLIDDDRLLFARPQGPRRGLEYFAYRPADRSSSAVVAAADVGEVGLLDILPFDRDARDRIWLSELTENGYALLALDPATLRLERLPVANAGDRAIARIGSDVITVEKWRRIVRTDTATGRREVLYPIDERGDR